MSRQKETASKLFLDKSETQEAKDLGIRLFLRNDGPHAKKKRADRVIYFQVKVEIAKKDGTPRLSWSAMKTTKTRDTTKAWNFAKKEAYSMRRRSSEGLSLQKITLFHLFQEYLKSNANISRAPATRRSTQSVFTIYSKRGVPVFKTIDVDEASADDFFRMIRFRCENQTTLRKGSRAGDLTLVPGKIGIQTLRVELATIRKVIRWADDRGGFLRKNTRALTTFPTSKKIQAQRRLLCGYVDFDSADRAHTTALTRNEVRSIVTTITGINDTLATGKAVRHEGRLYRRLNICRTSLATMLALSFGARIQEIMKMRWDDLIISPAGLVEIQMSRIAKNQTAHNKEVRVPFMPEYQPLIISLYNQLREISAKDTSVRTKALMFRNTDFSEKKQASLSITPVSKISGVPEKRTKDGVTTPLGFLALRRATITMLIESGFTAQEVAHQHGTSIKQIEKAYLRTDKDSRRRRLGNTNAIKL
jgi:integrase